MTPIPRLVGMVHLLPLPGAPRRTGTMSEVVETAIADATILVEAGFPALLVENFGDAPFHAGRVPPETVAAIAVATKAVVESTGAVVGVNVLRNDAVSALAVATATGARFIRVNVLIGTMYTDQGPIIGDAAEVARTRQRICPQVEVWADVLVKHAIPPPGSDPAHLARDTVIRGLADAVILSGSGTGEPTDAGQATVISDSVPDGTRMVIGSGANPDNLSSLMAVADTVIVGSSLKFDGEANRRVDPTRAQAMADAARSLGLF